MDRIVAKLVRDGENGEAPRGGQAPTSTASEEEDRSSELIL